MRTQIDFIGKRKIWMIVSACLIFAGIVSIAIPGRGLKLGIDFTGGLLVDYAFENEVTTAEMREVLAGIGIHGAQIQMSAQNEVLVRTRALTQEEHRQLNEALLTELGQFEMLRIEEVKPVIGRELTQRGLTAVALATLGMILYVTLRFEFKFAIAGIVALLHDVLIVIGAYSILGMEANSPLIAAVLTIVGYSINDTIVVFDRIRENMKTRRRESLKEITNLSINQTITRSLNTSLTTMLAILAVMLFGGRTIREFSTALFLGVAAGTYSSVFVASPVWYLWKRREERQGFEEVAPEPVAVPQAQPTKPRESKKASGKKRKK